MSFIAVPHVNSFVSIHSSQFVHFNSFMSVPPFHFRHVNSFISINSFRFICFNSFTSSPSFQFLFVNNWFQFIHDNSFVSIHAFQVLHFKLFISMDSCQFLHFLHFLLFQRTSFQLTINSYKPCLFFETSVPARAWHYLVFIQIASDMDESLHIMYIQTRYQPFVGPLVPPNDQPTRSQRILAQLPTLQPLRVQCFSVVAPLHCLTGRSRPPA